MRGIILNIFEDVDFVAAYTKNKSGYYRASIVTGYASDGFVGCLYVSNSLDLWL
jgi:hypothetical protein